MRQSTAYTLYTQTQKQVCILPTIYRIETVFLFEQNAHEHTKSHKIPLAHKDRTVST